MICFKYPYLIFDKCQASCSLFLKDNSGVSKLILITCRYLVIDRVAAVDKTIKQVNIALKEISVSPSNLSEYLLPLDLEGFERVPPADYLWFTQRVSYADPCEEFKKSLQKIKRKPTQ